MNNYDNGEAGLDKFAHVLLSLVILAGLLFLPSPWDVALLAALGVYVVVFLIKTPLDLEKKIKNKKGD